MDRTVFSDMKVSSCIVTHIHFFNAETVFFFGKYNRGGIF